MTGPYQGYMEAFDGDMRLIAKVDTCHTPSISLDEAKSFLWERAQYLFSASLVPDKHVRVVNAELYAICLPYSANKREKVANLTLDGR